MAQTTADEATDALIAQYLWREQQNSFMYEEFDEVYDSDDSDYSGKKQKKKKGGRKGAGQAKSARTDEPSLGRYDSKENLNTGGPNQEIGGDLTADGSRKKRKDLGQRREKGRPWTDQEETLFLEALDLYGRDWKKCGEHLTTRDSRAVASHAQKFFIKLCIQGKPLPAKVAESGLGYTLSGKLLDPTSAAAKAYGFKPEFIEKLQGVELQTALSGLEVPKLDLSRINCESMQLSAQQAQVEGQTEAAKVPAQPPKQSKPREKKQKVAIEEVSEAPTALAEPTEYVKNRPKRQVNTVQPQFMGETSESLQLMKCCEFTGPAGSGMACSQPFIVTVETEVLLVMDCHAHLSSYEIIGLLGGTWDAASRNLMVLDAYPCRRAAGSDARTSVELDPESEVEARAVMDQKSQRCIGWYHSHPTFEPTPSQKDCDNQRNYQAYCRDEHSNLEPYVGFIVGPYDMQLPTPRSQLSCFMVQQRNNQLLPFQVRYTTCSSSPSITDASCEKLLMLVDMFREDIGRIDLSEVWRPFSTLNQGLPDGDATTYLSKLMSSLAVHLQHVEVTQQHTFFYNLALQFQQKWNLNLGIQ